MRLTENFTFEELTHTNYKILLEKNREEAKGFIKQLKYNAGALEEIREILRVRIFVTSGFRGKSLNSLVGGSETSTHLEGTTSDVVPEHMSIDEAFTKIVANLDKLKSVKKIIKEKVKGKEWLHIEAKTKAEEQLVLYTTTDGVNYSKFIA